MAGNIKIFEHPEYAGNALLYRYHRDHFEGGKDYADKSEDYIPKFKMEDDDSYKARKKRAVYINYCEAVISIYQSAIWKNSPVRVLPDFLETISDDIDRLGTGANDFFQGVTEQAQAIGMHLVMVDAPVRDSGKTYTRQEAEKLKLRPYVVSIPAENVISWNIETEDQSRVGEFNFVVIEESYFSTPTPFVDAEAITQVRVLYPDRYEVYKKEGQGYTFFDGGSNSIGEVAIVPFYGRRKGFFQGESDLKKIAPLAQKIAEWLSLLDEDMLYHALRQLVIKTNADIAELGIGSNRAIKLRPDDGEDAFILESQGQASKELWASIVRLQDLIYRLATNQIAAIKDTAQVESAEKKKLDSVEMESLLMKKAGSFEQSEMKVWRLLAQYSGLSDAELNVQYHRDFVLSERTLEEWKELINMGILSVHNWIMAEHSTVDSAEDAQKILDENLKLRALVNDKVGLGDMLNQNRDEGDE